MIPAMDAAGISRDLFVARQPIFDLELKVVAYELLFRDSPLNSYPNVNGDAASAQTIHRALNVFGLEALAGNRRLYFNVTRQVLLSGLMHSLPPRLTTVEILESVAPDAEVIAACEALKKAGFGLALDDFVFSPGYEPLIALADVIKVDFLQTTGGERRAVVARHRRTGCGFLAEKIETLAEQADAVACGYTLLQGYFFARPQMLSAREIPTYKLNHLRLLQLVNDAELDVGKLQEVIKQDVSLSMKLLTYLNSAMFGWYQRVTSIQQALVLLGERPFRKWVAVLAIAGLSGDLPNEVVVMSLVRARFCERMAGRIGGNELELFLSGMLSLLDVMTGRPLAEATAQLHISEGLRAALLTRAGPMGMLLDMVQFFERADWPMVASLAQALHVDEGAFAEAYREAVEWADQVLTA
jgi:c-di-GMP-related signal transduction protein